MKKSLGLIFVIFPLSLILLTLGIFFVCMQIFGEVGKSNEVEDYQYRYYKYNSLTGEGIHGFSTLLKPLEDGEFLNYQNEKGEHFLISSFDTDEYKCTGNCYCKEGHRRKATVIRPIMCLVASASVAVAISIAGITLEENCQKELINECREESIISEVGECEHVYLSDASISTPSTESTNEVEEEAKIIEDQIKSDHNTAQRFHCTGHCLPRNLKWDLKQIKESEKIPELQKNLMTDNMDSIFKQSQKFECQKISLDKEFISEEDILYSHDRRADFAKVEFGNKHLSPFCMESSWQDVMLYNKWGTDYHTKMPMCGAGDEEGDNFSVKCVRAGE